MSLVDEWPHLYREGTDSNGAGPKGAGTKSEGTKGEGPKAAGPVLLMLHGTGSNEHDIATLAERLDPTATVLAPRGRVSEDGANRWFRRRAEGIFNVDDVILRANELAVFVAAAVSEYRLADRRIVAVGFSNGANIALALTILHPEVVSRVVSFSGMYPFGDEQLADRAVKHGDALTDVHVLLLNGSVDPMAPSPSVDRLEVQLHAHQATVDRVVREGGHGITEDELATARAWLTALN
jgi:phospholipase/carboxylesterase